MIQPDDDRFTVIRMFSVCGDQSRGNGFGAGSYETSYETPSLAFIATSLFIIMISVLCTHVDLFYLLFSVFVSDIS